MGVHAAERGSPSIPGRRVLACAERSALSERSSSPSKSLFGEDESGDDADPPIHDGGTLKIARNLSARDECDEQAQSEEAAPEEQAINEVAAVGQLPQNAAQHRGRAVNAELLRRGEVLLHDQDECTGDHEAGHRDRPGRKARRQTVYAIWRGGHSTSIGQGSGSCCQIRPARGARRSTAAAGRTPRAIAALRAPRTTPSGQAALCSCADAERGNRLLRADRTRGRGCACGARGASTTFLGRARRGCVRLTRRRAGRRPRRPGRVAPRVASHLP